ncbi:hypothetical protein R4369_44205 [Rhodococcus opacus]|nr:hypothetical protein [Rhodococcus opacus]MDV7091089.1 hypothetical protein [Rhodococcus opacus]
MKSDWRGLIVVMTITVGYNPLSVGVDGGSTLTLGGPTLTRAEAGR